MKRHKPLHFLPYEQVGHRANIVVDGAPLPSTVLTLSHWPVNTTPERFKRETSTETALAYVEQRDPRRLAGIVTNNHFDEDGLFSMFTVINPREALARRELLSDAARAGDFGVFRSRDAARLCFVVEAHADRQQSPLPRQVFSGNGARRVEQLYRSMLPRLPRLLDKLNSYRALWQTQDQHLESSEQLMGSGRAPLEEEPALDLAIIRIPHELPERRVWRYLRQEQAVVHPFSIHNRTRCTRLVRIQGRRLEVQYRYESWLQLPSRRPALRVDLTPLARWLNRRERNGCWIWENTLGLAPRLYLDSGQPSSLLPESVLRALRQHLRTQPPVWDPYDWVPGKPMS